MLRHYTASGVAAGRVRPLPKNAFGSGRMRSIFGVGLLLLCLVPEEIAGQGPATAPKAPTSPASPSPVAIPAVQPPRPAAPTSVPTPASTAPPPAPSIAPAKSATPPGSSSPGPAPGPSKLAPAPGLSKLAPAPAPASAARIAPAPALVRHAPAPAPFRLAPAPAPMAAQNLGLEAGDGLIVTPGLPLSPNGSVIPAVFEDLPASGALPDVPLDEEVVRTTQGQTAASEEIPPGVQVLEVLPGPAAPAPAPFGYLAPNAAPFGGLAPSRRGRRLMGFFDDIAGFFVPPKPPQKPTFTSTRIVQSTLDAYPRDRGLTYRTLSPSNYTLFASGSGPRVQDIFQTRLGDCWLQAAMVSTLDSGARIRIRDVNGDFKTFEMIFRVRTFTATVITDSQVLFQGNEPWTNAAPMDPVSKKNITWPLLWTKAYAILATRYPELIEIGDPRNGDTRPCRGGWCDLIGGLSYRAVLAHTGRPGDLHYMRGTIAAKQAGLTISDYPYFTKLLSRQVNLEILSTLSREQLKSGPRYINATKSVNVADYTLQIVDTGESLYSVRHRPTNVTFVLAFGHAMSVSLNSDGQTMDVANPWGYNPTLNAQGKRGPDSKDRYLRKIPLYVIEFAFLRLNFG
ncbi:hypothetical protein WJX74_000754 [Apatococcus lobatus]|uniref:Calpain catalytic domain-containing protein n=1 Tax=Apatococcus lobatus TaxID=904363 RepID=A0AAW1S2U5_9CHLO